MLQHEPSPESMPGRTPSAQFTYNFLLAKERGLDSQAQVFQVLVNYAREDFIRHGGRGLAGQPIPETSELLGPVSLAFNRYLQQEQKAGQTLQQLSLQAQEVYAKVLDVVTDEIRNIQKQRTAN